MNLASQKLSNLLDQRKEVEMKGLKKTCPESMTFLVTVLWTACSCSKSRLPPFRRPKGKGNKCMFWTSRLWINGMVVQTQEALLTGCRCLEQESRIALNYFFRAEELKRCSRAETLMFSVSRPVRCGGTPKTTKAMDKGCRCRVL